MKIQYASDLHLENLAKKHPNERLIKPHPEASVLVLAGDIHRADRAVDAFEGWPCPIVYVAGNHESDHSSINTVHKRIRERAKQRPGGMPFYFLENNAVVIGGVRFLGATLWTDYRLMEGMYSQQEMMRVAGLSMPDHFSIRLHGKRFTPEDALNFHLQSRAWLLSQLQNKPYHVQLDVVVSHHGCHEKSTHPRFMGDPLNPAFMSNLDDLLALSDVWIHGHVHNSVDYRVGSCRVLANPAGYIGNLSVARSAEQFDFENPQFDPCKCFDLAIAGSFAEHGEPGDSRPVRRLDETA